MRGRGEGSVYPRPDGLWAGQVSLGYDAEGKRVRRTLYGQTKGEVLDKMRQLRQDLGQGLDVKPQRITLAQHFEDWLRAKKPSVRASTFGSYRCIYQTHIRPVFGGMQVKSIDYRRINAFLAELDEKELSPRTVAYAAYLLRTVLEDAVRKGVIPRNPAKLAARRTSARKEARCLNQDEIRRFLDAAQGERMEDGFILALHTGLRPGEWLGLTWECVDWDNQKLTVKQALPEVGGKVALGELKTPAARRSISLSPTTIAALRRQEGRQVLERMAAEGEWRNDLNLVFTDTGGGPIRRTNLARRDLRRILRRAGLRGVSLHTFRHTHASILIFQGVDIKAISGRLGHENITTTLQVYGHLLPGQDERAAERMEEFHHSLS